MAIYPYSPIASSDWGPWDLRAYNISVHFQDAASFFGVSSESLQPQPVTVDEEVLTKLSASDMQDPTNYKFMRYVELATSPMADEESATVDFAVALLSLAGYLSPRTRIARTHTAVPLVICGKDQFTDIDVCIVDAEGEETVLLLMQEEKRHIETLNEDGWHDQQGPLVAGAISAFQTLNTTRTSILREDPVQAKVYPGVTFIGSSPTFYKIPVTEELAQAVSLGYFPPTPTVVHAHMPLVSMPTHGRHEGMGPLDNRRKVLACFEAFKQYVNW